MIAVGLVAIIFAWSVATPPNGGVDEPDHVIRSAAAVRLDFAGTKVESILGEATRHYDVPLALEGPDIVCWSRHQNISAACSTWPVDSSGRVGVPNSYYPPGYFLLTGWPTLITSRYAIVRFMRLLSGALAIAFVAAGLTAVHRNWGRNAVLVTMMALTPASLSLMGVVNPQALEIGAAFCFWPTAMTVLGTANPPRWQRWAFLVAGVVLCVTRPLGSLFTAIILCAVALAVGLRTALAAIRRPDVLAVVAVGFATAIVMALNGVTSLDAPELARHVTLSSTMKDAIGNSINDIRDAVSLTGWLDTKLPSVTAVFWFTGLSVLLGGLVVTKAYRQLSALAFMAAAFLTVKIWVLYTQANSNGLNWQGRYGVALYIGVAFVAMSLRPSIRPRVLQLAVVSFVALQWVALYWGLRRWTVGTDGPLFYPGREDWIPPVPAVVILALAAAGAWLVFAGARLLLAEREADALDVAARA